MAEPDSVKDLSEWIDSVDLVLLEAEDIETLEESGVDEFRLEQYFRQGFYSLNFEPERFDAIARAKIELKLREIGNVFATYLTEWSGGIPTTRKGATEDV